MFSKSILQLHVCIAFTFLPFVIAQCDWDHFACDGGCIYKSDLCNNRYDCNDRTDEYNCKCDYGPECYVKPVPSCKTDEFVCTSGDCIPNTWQCDGDFDCVDLSDENDCEKETCGPYQFTCDNGACIDTQLKCNEQNDCGDNSDENICQIRTVQRSTTTNQTDCGDAFSCKDGTCLPMQNVCDGVTNCPDDSDEGSGCSLACAKNQCDHDHQSTPNGCLCKCKKGYRLAGDGLTCVDALECLNDPPVCSQICIEAVGAYSCGCYKEYTMRYDNVTCKSRGSPMSIYYVVRNEIREYTPRRRNLHVVHVESGGTIDAFDMDIANQVVYYAVAGNSSLHQLGVLDKSRKSIANVGEIIHITLDWITQNVYFMSRNTRQASNLPTPTEEPLMNNTIQQLQVCNVKGRHCAVLYKSQSENLGPLVIDPLNKYLFYITSSSVGKNEIKLIRVGLGGEYPLVIAEFNMTITQLAVDYRKKHLYFTREIMRNDVPGIRVTIDRVDYNGGRTINIAEASRQTGALNIFEDQLYFLTDGGATMHKCRLYGEGRRCTSFRLSAEQTQMSFVIAQPTRQTPGCNACATYNCSHLCVPTQDGANCLCEDGQIVNEVSDCRD